MKLLFIAKHSPWHTNAWGGDRHTHTLACNLAEMGHDICYMTAKQDGIHNHHSENTNGLLHYEKMEYVWHRNRPFYPKTDQLLELLKDKSFDLIHHFSTMGYPIEQLRRKGKLTISSLCSLWSLRTAASGINKSWKFLLRGQPFRYLAMQRESYSAESADAVSVTSTDMKHKLSSNFNIPHSKIHRIPRGVDTNVFNTNLNSRLGKNKKVILTAARLEKEKGIQHLLDAMPKILEVIDNTLLIVAGNGKDERYLKQHVRKLGIKNYVKFIGKVSRPDMPTLYGMCDIFVLLSHFEPFGAVLLEAGSSKKPVIAFNNGGPRDIIINGKTGFLLKPFDLTTLIERILRLLTDDGLRKRMGEQGRKHILENFTWDHEAKAYDRLYTELITNCA